MENFVEVIIFLAVAVFSLVKFFADKKKNGSTAVKKEKGESEKTRQVTHTTITLEDLKIIKDMIGEGMSLQQAKEELFARKERVREEAEARERIAEEMAVRQEKAEARKAALEKKSYVDVHQNSQPEMMNTESKRKRQKSPGIHQAFSDAESLRRAFVVQEILKKPIALRSESEKEYYAESL